MTEPTRPAAMTCEGLDVEVRIAGRWVPAVTDVSLSVGEGEMVGVVGESGSGKSLTGLAMMGLLPYGARRASGTVSVAGRVVAGPGAEEVDTDRRRGLAMVFQNPMSSLNPAHKVGRQIAEAVRYNRPGTNKRAAMARAIELLSLVEIPDAEHRADSYPHQFSGGMRQRVMIAMALACDPVALIADEPTTALDVTVQSGVLDLFDRLRGELGLGVLFVSHDLALVSGRCQRVLVMYAGELVEVGPTGDVIHEPRQPYVSGLLKCIPDHALQTGVLQPLEGRVPRPGSYAAACRFADRCAWVIDQCRAAHPPLDPFTATRAVRCIRAGEIDLAAPEGREVHAS